MQYPAKMIEVTDGIIFIYNREEDFIKDPDVKIEIVDKEPVIIVADEYCIPVNEINFRNEEINLYLMGAYPADLKVKLFAIVGIDPLMAGKIVAYREIAETIPYAY